jgi:hypothetical protein
MNFFEIFNFQFCGVVKDFKLNPLDFFKKGFGSDMENPEGLIQCHAYHQKNATVKNSSKSMMSVVGDSSAEAESSVSIARVQKCNVDNIE